MDQIDISIPALLAGFAALLIPVFLLWKYSAELIKPMLWAFLRMALQLVLVGLYLQYIFDLNSIWINLAWVVLMLIAATVMIIRRSDLPFIKFSGTVLTAITAGFIINAGIFAFIILGLENFLDARYIIPVSGMLIGNSIAATIVGLRSFFHNLKDNEEKYKFYLLSGATREEALFDFISKSFKDSFNPWIASPASIGLIWLPGMMTGQIV